MNSERISGSDAMLRSLLNEGVDTVFGYPGGQIMPVYDRLYDYGDSLRHILVRHEQGAIHAAQGYARVSGKTGVVLVTSGPGATNVLTGVADAMTDSTPVVVICGQVPSGALGTDAFQEADIIGLTGPITKWNYQIRRAEDVAWAVARAFHIASTGRPGPVVLDFTKDAQLGMIDYSYSKCSFIRSYLPEPEADPDALDRAAALIDKARRPFVVFGQGILLSGAQSELTEFLRKGDIPAASTLLGLSALPSDLEYFCGMTGMHGNIAPNILTNSCDLLIAVGMRFDDRVTGVVSEYARGADVIHIDIDPSEIGKIIPVTVGIAADARKALAELCKRISKASHTEWRQSLLKPSQIEREKVIEPEIHPQKGHIRMGEVVDKVAEISAHKAVIVTDVGQNQMVAARYSKFCEPRSFISSGGLGTMGFGLPAAIGAKVAAPGRQVCLFVGDGGIQMTLQELGTIMQERIGVKIVILNNNWLGNVRQWQELFFNGRYSQTRMMNPDYIAIAAAYGIRARRVSERQELGDAIREMLESDDAFVLDVCVEEAENVMPMVPPGRGIGHIMLNESELYEG